MELMRKKVFVLIPVFVFLFVGGLVLYNHMLHKGTYVKAATYFSDQWPLSFWNGEMKELDRDFKQIKADGFNAIVLLIPWKEFQPSTDPIQYNDYAIEKYKTVMQAADDNQLTVYLRLGYVWDFYNDENEIANQRFVYIMGLKDIYAAWLDYSKTIYDISTEYDSFGGAFITWEDFWPILDQCYNTDPIVRCAIADDVGYQEWVVDKYGLEKYNETYGTEFLKKEDIMLPHKNEATMYAMFEFYDDRLMYILSETQKVFPNLSMEVRIEKDSIKDQDGNLLSRYTHDGTFSCANSDYVSLMYRIPMGFKYEGQELTCEEAVSKTGEILGEFYEEISGKPVFIDQFLFYDNTPGHESAPYLDSDLNAYLESISDVLQKYTMGYAVWAYKDYRANMIFNSQFAMGNTGWEMYGNPDFGIVNDSYACTINAGDNVTQKIPLYRNAFDNNTYCFEFDVLFCDPNTKILVSMGSETKELDRQSIIEGKNIIIFNKNDSFDISIEVKSGSIIIDDTWLYGYIQNGKIYNQFGEELDCIESIRHLNRLLSR